MGTNEDVSREEKVATHGGGLSWDLFVLSEETARLSAETQEGSQDPGECVEIVEGIRGFKSLEQVKALPVRPVKSPEAGGQLHQLS